MVLFVILYFSVFQLCKFFHLIFPCLRQGVNRCVGSTTLFSWLQISHAAPFACWSSYLCNTALKTIGTINRVLIIYIACYLFRGKLLSKEIWLSDIWERKQFALITALRYTRIITKRLFAFHFICLQSKIEISHRIRKFLKRGKTSAAQLDVTWSRNERRH